MRFASSQVEELVVSVPDRPIATPLEHCWNEPRARMDSNALSSGAYVDVRAVTVEYRAGTAQNPN